MARSGSRRPELEPERRGRRARAKHNGIWTTRATLCLLSDGARRTAVDCRWRLSAWRRLNFSASPTNEADALIRSRDAQHSLGASIYQSLELLPDFTWPRICISSFFCSCLGNCLPVCSSARLFACPAGRSAKQPSKRTSEQASERRKREGIERHAKVSVRDQMLDGAWPFQCHRAAPTRWPASGRLRGARTKSSSDLIGAGRE